MDNEKGKVSPPLPGDLGPVCTFGGVPVVDAQPISPHEMERLVDWYRRFWKLDQTETTEKPARVHPNYPNGVPNVSDR